MTANRTCDVFISHAAPDATLAQTIAQAFRASGLDAVTPSDIRQAEQPSDRLWDALAESRAVVVIVPVAGPTPAMGIEMGAAAAWNKLVVGIVTDEGAAHRPANLPEMRLFTAGRIDDVIRLVEQSGKQLSSSDIVELKSLYAEMATPVDRYVLETPMLTELTKRFRKRTRNPASGEHLLSELLRLRKQGLLSRTSPRPKPIRAAKNGASRRSTRA
jgi:hypothetical protein